MSGLDKVIVELFWKMIKSPDKIVNIENGEIKFDNKLSIRAFKKTLNMEIEKNEPLKLDAITFSFYRFSMFDVVIPDTDKLIFCINTPYKQYVVPEFTKRHEYAEVLDTIDNSLKEFEKRKLDEYNEHFTPKVSFSDTIIAI